MCIGRTSTFMCTTNENACPVKRRKDGSHISIMTIEHGRKMASSFVFLQVLSSTCYPPKKLLVFSLNAISIDLHCFMTKSRYSLKDAFNFDTQRVRLENVRDNVIKFPTKYQYREVSIGESSPSHFGRIIFLKSS